MVQTSAEQLEGGAGGSSKAAGGVGFPRLWADNKLNIHFEENVTRKDAVIEMHDLLRLTQMDRQMRPTLLLTEASGLNYTGLSAIK